MVHSNGRATRDSEALRYSELHEIRFLCANITSLGEPRLAAVSRAVTKYWNRSRARDNAKNEVPAAQRSFAEPRTASTCQQRDAQRRHSYRPRSGRADERRFVGSCKEFGRPCHLGCSVGRSLVCQASLEARLSLPARRA